MAAAATLVMWFSLRSPELAEDFERLMASDRDIVRSSLNTMSDYRLTRPMDVPGQAGGGEAADYVLMAEIVNVENWEQQAEERTQELADDLAHLVSSRKYTSSNASFETSFSSDAASALDEDPAAASVFIWSPASTR
jgi:hypothetical protein